MNNMSILTPEGKIGLLPIGPDGERWMILFTHILEEYGSRGCMLPNISGMPFPKPTVPDFPQAALALKKVQVPDPGQTLIKLGKRVHMQELHEKGRLRVSPASSYLDPSLNYAVNDDELEFTQVTPGSEITITYMDEKTGEMKSANPIGEVSSTTRLTTNFYVYCMTHALDYRLFDDFGADSCVIVRDPSAFCTRLQGAVMTQFPNWLCQFRSVKYIDPYLHQERDIDLFFLNIFDFGINTNFVFLGYPKQNAPILSPSLLSSVQSNKFRKLFRYD